MNVEVTTRGPVAQRDVDKLKRELAELEDALKCPLLGVRAVLVKERNPSFERPARAEARANLAGTRVYARVNAVSMSSAVDELSERMARRLRRHADRVATDRRRGTALVEPGEWLHAAERAPCPQRAPCDPGARRVVRRKSFAVGSMEPAEALVEMEALDHNFHLFHDIETGADALAYNRDDGRLGVLVPRGTEIPLNDGPVWEESRYSEPLTEASAVAEMDALAHRFLYFQNAATGRANVIYLRFDGHYGLIEPAD